MEQPIYKLWLMKYKDAWYRLSPEEQHALEVKVEEALKNVGGERLLMRVSVWASEEWMAWGVEKFPNIQAVQAHAMALFAINHYQYVESVSYLGVEMPQM